MFYVIYLKKYNTVMKLFVSALLVVLSSITFAQSTWHFSAGTTIGFVSKDVYLWKYEVTNKHSLGVFAHAGYEYTFFEKYSVRIKAGINQYYANIKVNGMEVKGYNYHLELPVDLRYTYKKRYIFGAGVAFKDYRSLEDQAMVKSNNVRLDLILSFEYQFNKHWAGNFSYSKMLSKEIDALIVLNYTDHFSFGVTYLLGHRVKVIENLSL